MAANPDLDAFMAQFLHEGLTFDDVSLVTRYADFLPPDTSIHTRFTRRVGLNVPFVSAAMDTVTEADMAIGMAMLGGIGVIHKNLTIERQVELVDLVKHHLNGLIADPVTFRDDMTLEELLAAKRERRIGFSGFPILNAEGRLSGILTSKDIRFATQFAMPVGEIMTRQLITAPPETSLEEAYRLMQQHKIGKLPLVDDDGRLVGLYSYTDVRTLIENRQPLYNRDEQYRLRVAAAVGPYDDERIEALCRHEVDVVVVDTAHGHSQGVIDTTAWIKQNFPQVDVVAGNIATAEAALALREAGADAVKVGIGPGSICTTRVVTGVGIPQVTAIYACSKALEDVIPVVADGGIRHSGDVTKALAAGASCVMMGSVLAGTDESPGEKIIYQGRQYVSYRGMGSLGAMHEGAGSRQRYGQQSVSDEELVPQGIEGIVPFAGTVRQVLTQYGGGLQAGLGYCGCQTVQELRERARFVRVSNAGTREAHAHDVLVTKEAPNYRQK